MVDVTRIKELPDYPEPEDEARFPVEGQTAPTGSITFAQLHALLKGEDGADGANFAPDVAQNYSAISTYDNELTGFAFLAVDQGMVYFKLSDEVGVWSVGVPWVGPQGEPGEQGPAAGYADIVAAVQPIEDIQNARITSLEAQLAAAIARIDALSAPPPSRDPTIPTRQFSTGKVEYVFDAEHASTAWTLPTVDTTNSGGHDYVNIAGILQATGKTVADLEISYPTETSAVALLAGTGFKINFPSITPRTPRPYQELSASSTTANQATYSFPFAHAVPEGADDTFALFRVVVHADPNVAQVSEISTATPPTWNGTPLTRIDAANQTDANSSTKRVRWYMLELPEDGTHNLVLTMDSTGGKDHHMVSVTAYFMQDVDLDDPIGAISAPQDNSANAVALSLTTTSPMSLVVAGASFGSPNTNPVTTPTTEEQEETFDFDVGASGAGGAHAVWGSIKPKYLPGTTTIGGTLTTTDGIMALAIEIRGTGAFYIGAHDAVNQVADIADGLGPVIVTDVPPSTWPETADAPDVPSQPTNMFDAMLTVEHFGPNGTTLDRFTIPVLEGILADGYTGIRTYISPNVAGYATMGQPMNLATNVEFQAFVRLAQRCRQVGLGVCFDILGGDLVLNDTLVTSQTKKDGWRQNIVEVASYLKADEFSHVAIAPFTRGLCSNPQNYYDYEQVLITAIRATGYAGVIVSVPNGYNTTEPPRSGENEWDYWGWYDHRVAPTDPLDNIVYDLGHLLQPIGFTRATTQTATWTAAGGGGTTKAKIKTGAALGVDWLPSGKRGFIGALGSFASRDNQQRLQFAADMTDIVRELASSSGKSLGWCVEEADTTSAVLDASLVSKADMKAALFAGTVPSLTSDHFYTVGNAIFQPNGEEIIFKSAGLFPTQASLLYWIFDVWGFNQVRLAWTTSGNWSLSQAYQVIEGCAARGKMCVFDYHPIGGYTDPAVITALFLPLYNKYKGTSVEPFLAFEVQNEPGGPGDCEQVGGVWQFKQSSIDQWINQSRTVASALRGEGYQGLIYVNAPVTGQDILINGSGYSQQFSRPIGERSAVIKYGADILEDNENIVFDVHLYNNYDDDGNVDGTYERRAYLGEFLDAAAAAGYPIHFMETGSVNESTSNPVIASAINMQSFFATKKFSRGPWIFSAQDANDLTTGGAYGGGESVNSITAPTNLTTLGSIFWADTHAAA